MTMTSARPHSRGYPGYSTSFPCEEATAGEARFLVRDALGAWGLDADTDPCLWVLTELVTNAVQHTTSRRLRVVVDRPRVSRVHLAVIDRAPHLVPQQVIPTEDATSGRGLLMVCSLSAEWGWFHLGPKTEPWGKRVWAEVDVKPEAGR